MPTHADDTVDIEALTFRQVDGGTWADFERLFESRGAPKYCWCMVWRAMGDERKKRDPESRKSFMRRRVMKSVPVGILGYLDGQPIAWCSIAPRPSYRPLGGLDDQDEDPDRVWSLVCFYVPRSMRGHGLSRRLISAAVEHARQKGAVAVEAYPVEPDSPSYRFMGHVSSFKAEGFREVGRAGTRRHVMRLDLL
jgi:GNAT superfamily N-acetyltransferase